MKVEFDEQPSLSRKALVKPSFFERLVLGTGLAKTAQGAQIALLIVAFLLLLLAGYFFMQTTREAPEPNPADYAVWPT